MPDLEAARQSLDSAVRAASELTLLPPAPLRRPPSEALEAIQREAAAVLRGDEPADRRRRGPGRRATDYRP